MRRLETQSCHGGMKYQLFSAIVQLLWGGRQPGDRGTGRFDPRSMKSGGCLSLSSWSHHLYSLFFQSSKSMSDRILHSWCHAGSWHLCLRDFTPPLGGESPPPFNMCISGLGCTDLPAHPTCLFWRGAVSLRETQISKPCCTKSICSLKSWKMISILPRESPRPDSSLYVGCSLENLLSMWAREGCMSAAWFEQGCCSGSKGFSFKRRGKPKQLVQWGKVLHIITGRDSKEGSWGLCFWPRFLLCAARQQILAKVLGSGLQPGPAPAFVGVVGETQWT